MKKLSVNSILRVTLPTCICLLLLSFCILSGIYARYTTKVSSGDTARVAKFVFSDDAQAQMTATLDLTGIKPGTSKDFVVSVTNQSGDQVCETSMRYHLEVRTKYGSLPLTFTVKNQQTSESKTASIVTTTASDIAAGAPTTHTYTITVAWPANEDAYEFANKIDIVTVTVVADQID